MKYRIYLVLPDQTKVWCIGPNRKNQVTSDRESAGEFPVEGDIDEYVGHIQDGLNEALRTVPKFKNRPEWKGYSLKDVKLYYEEVRKPSGGGAEQVEDEIGTH